MENFDDIVNEHNEAVRIERLTHHIARIREGMDEMKAAMKEMATAMTRLALVEERQSNAMTAMQRIGNTLDRLEQRVTVLETQQPLQSRTTQWVEKMVWTGFVAALTFIGVSSGLL